MEVFLEAEVKETRTYVTMVCNVPVHISPLKICGILHCVRNKIILIFVPSDYLHYDGALN
jgi:hypothetical protein